MVWVEERALYSENHTAVLLEVTGNAKWGNIQ